MDDRLRLRDPGSFAQKGRFPLVGIHEVNHGNSEDPQDQPWQARPAPEIDQHTLAPIDVLHELTTNAAKYGAQVPQVYVQASVHGEKNVIVKISDNGKGVNSDLRRKIFKRFYRGGSELDR